MGNLLQIVVVAASILSVSAIASSSPQSDSGLSARMIVVKRTASGQAIFKRDLASNLVTDKAAAVVADSLVGTDTKAKAAALIKDNAAIATLNTATGIATPLDATTASLLALSNTAASKAATDLATYNAAALAAKPFDDTVKAVQALVSIDTSALNSDTATLSATQLLITFIPTGWNFEGHVANFISAENKLKNYVVSGDTTGAAGANTAAQTEFTYLQNNGLPNTAVNAKFIAFATTVYANEAAHNALYAAFQTAQTHAATLKAAVISAVTPDSVASASLIVSKASTTAATAALAAYNAALILSSTADTAVTAANTVKTTADQTLTAAGTLLTADTLADSNANAKVVADQSAITTANTLKALADTADALAISTKSTTDAASVALNSAQATLKTDSLPIAALSSASDKAANIKFAAGKAASAAGDAAKASAEAVGTAQNLYNSALIKSTASSKTYTDAFSKYTAMIHGGAKNLALTALATPKTISSNDAISTLAANTKLFAAQSADSQAKKNVLSTSAAFTSTSTKAKAASDTLALANTKVNNDSNAVTAAQSAYTAAKVLSDSAAANKITADHTYKCTLGPC